MIEAQATRHPSVVAEALTGWRTWRLRGSRDGSRVRLLPVVGDQRPWPPLRPARAACRRRRHGRIPGATCSCGLYATHGPDLLRRTRDPAVVGTVALWGRVLEHEHGYRAEWGYPQRLALVCRVCFWQWGLASSARSLTVVRRRGGELVPMCAEHLALSDRCGYPSGRPLDATLVEGSMLDAYAVDLFRPA